MEKIIIMRSSYENVYRGEKDATANLNVSAEVVSVGGHFRLYVAVNASVRYADGRERSACHRCEFDFIEFTDQATNEYANGCAYTLETVRSLAKLLRFDTRESDLVAREVIAHYNAKAAQFVC